MLDIKIKKPLYKEKADSRPRNRGFFKKLFACFFVMFLGAFGALLVDRAIFPYLAETDFFKDWDFIQKTADRTTIINKTEKIEMPADFLGVKIFEENKAICLEIIFEAETGETVFSSGFAFTQDGLLFAGLPQNLPEKIKSIKIKNANGEENSAELAQKMDNFLLLRKNGGSFNMPVLQFEKSLLPGEEVSVITQKASMVAFVKSVSESRILLNDYPDQDFNGSPVLNKNQKIIGIYRTAVEEDKLVSYVIPAEIARVEAEKQFNR
ncbi:MAG: hypothetical protein V1698_01080 [bacterium]